jgi:hypothetical protein
MPMLIEYLRYQQDCQFVTSPTLGLCESATFMASIAILTEKNTIKEEGFHHFNA